MCWRSRYVGKKEERNEGSKLRMEVGESEQGSERRQKKEGEGKEV
jgi:hypothetical protein